MSATNIVKCPKCGIYLLAKQKQKTKTCSACNTNMNLQSAQRIAAANTSFEASEILKKLKNEKGFSR